MPLALSNPSRKPSCKEQALDAVRSIRLPSVALAATAAVEGGQGERAHAPSPVEP